MCSATEAKIAGAYPNGRAQILASLGDGVHYATVESIGSTPFNTPVALIFTPDQGTDARVRAALRRAGYPAAIINDFRRSGVPVQMRFRRRSS